MLLDEKTQIRLPKASEIVAAELRKEIASRQLKEGDRLPKEQALMKRFKISRPTLRESLRILESQSLIQVTRGARGGARVTFPDIDIAASQAAMYLISQKTTVLDLHVARETIEPRVVFHLAMQSTKEDIKALRNLVKAVESSIRDVQGYRTYDLAFHERLVTLSHNKVFELLIGILRHLIGTSYALFTGPQWESGAEMIRNRRTNLAAQHKLLDLIEAHDAPGAEKHWQRHLQKLTRLLIKQGAGKKPLELG